MAQFVCRVMHTSRTVMCVSTETWKNMTNHRDQSQNQQSGFERTCPPHVLCVGHVYDCCAWFIV